jgi:cysteine synthase
LYLLRTPDPNVPSNEIVNTIVTMKLSMPSFFRRATPRVPEPRRGLHVAARPSDLIGNTPLLDLSPLLAAHGITNGATLYGKLESLGPCSSVKDRIGKYMIDDAEAQGKITPGHSVLVEPTSGNTGIALAFIARERGYRCILTMPETMSVERRMMLLALGCEVVLTPKETAVPGALAKAHEILQQLGPGVGYMLQQFENPANPRAHRETTGPEIWRDTDGGIDIFVSGIGTGGTVTGVSQYIKGKYEGCPPLNPNLRTVAIEPREQMLITEAKGLGPRLEPQGPHKIQGMGAGLVPAILDLDLLDVVIPVHSDDAMAMTHELWMMGLPVGVSAGAIVAGALVELAKPESAGKMCVAMIPSFGERYFSHPMFSEIKEKAEHLTKQPLPEPYDNTAYGFATPRG